MQRVKLPAGVISSLQARVVCEAAERFGKGSIHLTTRGSMELHWLRESDLPAVRRLLTSAGLTSRGACGGAVRGITCGSGHGSLHFPLIEDLARRLQRHFAGNPRFERLPKKFKIGIEADVSGKRHLIQDVGLVLNPGGEGQLCYDMYVAGGLGREPRAGFLLAAALTEERIIPMIEAVVRVYAAGTPAGKRLKHLLAAIGEQEFRRRVAEDLAAAEELPPRLGLSENILAPVAAPREWAEAFFFAGQLSSDDLRNVANLADEYSDGVMLVTAEQNIALPVAQPGDPGQARQALAQAGFIPDRHVTLRVCPGSHECRMGLAPTRDIARSILAAMGPAGEGLTWGISGCNNSCSQPQLADVGIVIARLAAEEDGQRTPRFDLYRSVPTGLGEKVAASLNLTELLEQIASVC
ncbi:nitrite reductase [Geobacter sp. SVR]|nr:nitrite reductase [Geobacter sp. SVR]GCF87380.1 nitrite reductase [Geobacter sp. SVR]